MSAPEESSRTRAQVPILFLHVLVIAACGLVYELLAGTLASYVLGDSVTQFSLVIGIYLSALGVGAWLSGFIESGLARKFIEVELGVAILGGTSAPLLFLSFARLTWFHPMLYGIVFGIGVLVGLELPLLMRILKDQLDFKHLVSRVLAFDYIGALVASLFFPIVLVPELGLVRTSLLCGILNAGVGLWGTYVLRDAIGGGLTALRVGSVLVMALLGVSFVKADALTSLAEESLFADPVVYAKTTPYQRIVVTRGPAGFHLFLNGNLQFNSADEYRYHESLVHPALLASRSPRRVLILGGGDGLALREVLKYIAVENVTLVDLDPAMTELGRTFAPLVALNAHSFSDPRVHVVNEDAMTWLEKPGVPADVAIVDFPDPNNYSLGKLYTTRFYRLLKARLDAGATVGVQTTSPMFARKSYWCIVRTIEAAGFAVKPYQATVPSFGVWGFVLAGPAGLEPPTKAPPGLRFLNDAALTSLFVFPADLTELPAEVNRLDNQVLVRYYESEWKKWQ